MIRRIVAYEDHDAPMSRVEVPTLGVALILSFGPTMRVEGQTVSSFLVGMWDKPALTEHDGDAHGIQIDLAPAVAYALVGGRMDELTNRAIDLGELDVVSVDRLLEGTDDDIARRARLGCGTRSVGVAAKSIGRTRSCSAGPRPESPRSRKRSAGAGATWSTAFDEKWDSRPSASREWPGSGRRSTDSARRRRSPLSQPSAGMRTSRI